MKGIILTGHVGGKARSSITTYVNGRPRVTLGPITDFSAQELQESKERFLQAVKPLIKRGGFLFDPKLYRFTTTRDSKGAHLWVYITFLDDQNEGSTAFNYYVRLTGLFNYGYTFYRRYGNI